MKFCQYRTVQSHCNNIIMFSKHSSDFEQQKFNLVATTNENSASHCVIHISLTTNLVMMYLKQLNYQNISAINLRTVIYKRHQTDRCSTNCRTELKEWHAVTKPSNCALGKCRVSWLPESFLPPSFLTFFTVL